MRELLTAIRSVGAGGIYLDPALEHTTLPVALDASGGMELSAREAEVLRLIAQGFCNREIAESLGLSTKTAETYKARSLEKLGLSRRADIVRFAVERGWLGRTAIS